jgi:6-pyruvoyltetrahydropterin/6-carboxytetrahydropterin synthase
MTVTIAKHFTFDAAHFLPTVPEHHKCRRMHGHTYGVELRFVGSPDASGFCAGIDYADIAAIWARIFDRVDHRLLNEVPGLEVPTTEILVSWIAGEFRAACGLEHEKMRRALASVRVSESATTWCEIDLRQQA